MDNNWFSDNLVGMIAIVVAILIVIIPFIIRKLRKQDGLKIVLRQDQDTTSYFCVEGGYTRIRAGVAITNNEDFDIVITEYRFKITSPFKDRYKTTERYKTGETASDLTLGYGQMPIKAGRSEGKDLTFKAPVIRLTTKNLKCKLRIRDKHRRYSASCKFNLPRVSTIH